MDVRKGVFVSTFVSKAKEANDNIIVVAVSIYAASDNLAKLVSALENEGLRSKVAVMIGGAAVTKEDADKIGVLYGKTRKDAVVLAKKGMEEKKKP